MTEDVAAQVEALEKKAEEDQGHFSGCACGVECVNTRRAVRQLAVLGANNLGPLVRALGEIAGGEETSYLACPGPPNCGGSGAHYPGCPVQIAANALAAVDAQLAELNAETEATK